MFFLQAPAEWEPSDPRGFCKLNAPTYGLNDAPAAFHRTLQKYLTNSDASIKAVGLIYTVSSFDPCLYFIYDQSNVAAGVFTTHIDDILGCGVPGILERTRQFLQKRFGGLKLQESDFVHVGMELSQGSDFSVRLTQLAFTGNLLPMDTSPILWADRQKPLDDENKLRCHCKQGEALLARDGV